MDLDHVKQVRRFNRAITHRTGALNASFLGRGRPLSEVRLLFEIGTHGAYVRELRARLSLDSGYLSRLLRTLEKEKLITSKRAAQDARIVTAELTEKGKKELQELDRRSDDFAREILEPLSQAQRDRLVKAMTEVECLMRTSFIRISIESPDSNDAKHCLFEFFRELTQRFRSGFDPAKSISATAAELTPPAGYMFVARLDGRPIGCGALKVRDKKLGEVKRMWVDRSARGIGAGRRILEAVESKAREIGLSLLRLETNDTLKEAQGLYRGAGYREVSAFSDEPYAHHWFEKSLRTSNPKGKSKR